MKFGTKNIKECSAKNILSQVSEYDIFNYYITGLEKPNKPFRSEIRKDHSPTCRVSLLNNGWRYKDFGTGEHFTCFGYVMEKYGLKYVEALRVISIDFGLGLTYTETVKKIPKIPKEVLVGRDMRPQKETIIKIVSRKWYKEALEYWEQYNISENILNKFDVVPIEGYYINNTYYDKRSELAFCYQFGNFKYKVLVPYSKYKWTSNAASIQGLNQLKPGGLLFITSSLKDVMTLDSIGYKAIAPQSENTLLSKKLFNKLKKNFDELVVYYNNDAPGIQAAVDHCAKYKINTIANPEGEPKDPSDFVKEYNSQSLKKLLQQYGF